MIPNTPKTMYSQVREQLRRRIESGEWTPGTKLPPETELFKQLGASNTTVVRALNDLVREGLIVRRRGSGTVVALREHPPLIPGRTLKLGILWLQSVRACLFNSFCHSVSLGAMAAWGVQGVEPELDEDRAGTYTRGTWRQPARGLTIECLGNEWGGQTRAPSIEVVRNAGYDAVMTVGILEEPWLQQLLALNLPTVIVDFPTQRFATQADLVYADPQSGYRAAIDYFVSRGLRRVHFAGAYVWDPQTRFPDPAEPSGFRCGIHIDPDTFLRQSAYRQAMSAHGITVPESWVHCLSNRDKDWVSPLMSLPESDWPQAFVCHDLGHAEKLITDCAARGIPLEAAGGSDRVNPGRALSICLNVRQMGAVAAELLLARLKQPARPFLNVGVRMTFQSPESGQPAPVVPEQWRGSARA